LSFSWFGVRFETFHQKGIALPHYLFFKSGESKAVGKNLVSIFSEMLKTMELFQMEGKYFKIMMFGSKAV